MNASTQSMHSLQGSAVIKIDFCIWWQYLKKNPCIASYEIYILLMHLHVRLHLANSKLCLALLLLCNTTAFQAHNMQVTYTDYDKTMGIQVQLQLHVYILSLQLE